MLALQSWFVCCHHNSPVRHTCEAAVSATGAAVLVRCDRSNNSFASSMSSCDTRVVSGAKSGIMVHVVQGHLALCCRHGRHAFFLQRSYNAAVAVPLRLCQMGNYTDMTPDTFRLRMLLHAIVLAELIRGHTSVVVPTARRVARNG